MDAITNDVNRILIILGIVSLALFALMGKLIQKIKGTFKPYVKATIGYSLITLLLFAAIGLTAHPSLYTDPPRFLAFCQLFFVLAGFLHYYLIHYFLQWTGDESTFWTEILYTFILSMLGSICFMLVYRRVNNDGMYYLMATSSIFFLIPLFIFHTFRKATAVPPKVFKQWIYPFDESIEEPDESKLKNLLVISFEFPKQTEDNHYTNFRAKAPTDMEFGKLFYYFINDYNERHPNSRIEYISSSGSVQGWTFYKKMRWYSFATQYIDSDKTIYTNNIRENDVIICRRSLN
jgi:Type VI secretion system, TssN